MKNLQQKKGNGGTQRWLRKAKPCLEREPSVSNFSFFPVRTHFFLTFLEMLFLYVAAWKIDFVI